jgi:hypothetical protein
MKAHAVTYAELAGHSGNPAIRHFADTGLLWRGMRQGIVTVPLREHQSATNAVRWWLMLSGSMANRMAKVTNGDFRVRLEPAQNEGNR